MKKFPISSIFSILILVLAIEIFFGPSIANAATNYSCSASADCISANSSPGGNVSVNWTISDYCASGMGITQDVVRYRKASDDWNMNNYFSVPWNTSYNFSGLSDGTYDFSIKLNQNSTKDVYLTFPCDASPQGWLDYANCSALGGWAYDPDTPNDGIAIHVYIDGPGGFQFLGSIGTSEYRGDVNSILGISGNHGYSLTIPDWVKNNSNYSVYAYGINSNSSGANAMLSGSPKTINCAPVINGGWTDWSAKNNSCGYSGTQTRTCTNPAPSGGGATCSGSSTQSYTNPPCSTVSCSISPTSAILYSRPSVAFSVSNGSWCDAYHDWTLFYSGFSNSGTVNIDASSLGNHEVEVGCYNSAGVHSGWNYCSYNVVNAPINGGWSAWSTPNSQCGYSGTQTRTCTNPSPAYGGTDCSGPSTQSYTNPQCLPTASCSVSPNPISYAGNPGITLTSTYGYYCHVYNDGANVSSGYFNSGTYYPGPQTSSGSHQGSVYCYNSDWVGSGWNYCGYTVNAQTPISVSISANPTSMTLPTNSTRLTWTTTGNPDSCTASNYWSGSKATGGGYEDRTGMTAGVYNFVITCSKAGTSDTSASVNVVVSATAPIVVFAANPTTVAYGGLSTLSWTSYNTSSCTASGNWSGSKSLSGSGGTGSLTSNKSYTITCSGDGGSQPASATVSVSANQSPVAPTISGPASGIVNSNYNYSFVSTDPESQQIRYGIDWNMDGSADEWLPAGVTYVNSGTSQNVNHSWTSSGTKTFQALAQDTPGQNSSWRSYSVTISNAPVTGVCGTANRTYPVGASGYGGDTYCSAGTPSSQPAFPAPGASVNWTCLGSNGGSNSPQCTATLTQTLYSVTVTPTAGGSVESVDNAINCGNTCAYNYPSGSTVTLKPYPASQYWGFTGWSGACSGTGDCVLNVNGNKVITPSFTLRFFNYREF